MKTTNYIHTIDGRPGSYDGTQVCFCSKTWPARMVSYATLLRERASTVKWRKKNGFPLDSKYGHIRVATLNS